MFFITLKTILIYLLLISLIHYLYGFFKNTLTVPKIKDLVNKPANSYKEMFEIINNENPYRANNHNNILPNNTNLTNLTNMPNLTNMTNDQSMEYELKNFLNELKKPQNSDTF
jgi:hypothetical protein